MLSDEVLRFLRTWIASVWALELLLLLQRRRERAWKIEDLIRELRGSIGIVTTALSELQNADLVTAEPDGSFRYRPSTPELDGTVAAVAKAYADYPYAVSQAIFTAPSHKIQLFADAFRIKKE